MTTKEQVNKAKKMYCQAVRNYIDTAKKAVIEHCGFRLMDEASDEDGKPVRIHLRGYVPVFDKVDYKVLLDGRIILVFHIFDGNNFCPSDTTWISEDEIDDDNLMELLDHIAWDVPAF